VWGKFAEKHAYGHGPFGINFHEALVSLKNSAHYLIFLLQNRMLLRLIPGHGCDGMVYCIIAMNDTSSDMLTLFNTDLAVLGNIQGYSGWQLLAGGMDLFA
jgi:hypothetical protein